MPAVKRPQANRLQGNTAVLQGSSPALQKANVQVQGAGTPQYRMAPPPVYSPNVLAAATTAGNAMTAEQAAYAAAQAADAKKRGDLRGKAGGYLDQLAAMYSEIMNLIKKTGADSTTRINKSYDGKILEQTEQMNDGMYSSDVANAASNLANSSFVAFDRGKIRKAADSNKETLNEARSNDLSTIGKMVSEDTARYQADSENLGRTRELLGQTEDISELTGTVNNLGNTISSTQAARGKYGSRGEFVSKANALGNYDTSVLEKTLQSVVANTSSSAANKSAAIDDLLNGTPLAEDKKKELKNKYTQVV